MAAWDLYQHQQIRSVRLQQLSAEQDRLRREHRTGDEIAALHERVDRLALLVKAFWRVTNRLEGFSDDLLVAELRALVEEQVAQGASAPTDCSCGSKVAADLDRCTYCGQAQARPFDPFDV